MANLKTKSPKFISLAGEMEPGGAPIYADDIIRVQENDQADILNFFEANRRLLPELLTWDGVANTKQFESGLILSGLEYDNTDPANPVVSPGYILSGGEVCYYPGNTIATGLLNRGLLYLYKGAAVNTARTFSVGGSKNILVTHDIVVETGQVTGNGLELAGGSAITATDEVVVLGIGIAGPYLGEDYFTMRTAQGITEIGSQVEESVWVSGSPAGGPVTVGPDHTYWASRVNKDGTTEIRGGLYVNTGVLSTGSEILGTLNASNVTLSTVSLTADAVDSLQQTKLRVIVTFGGTVRLIEPAAGWASLGGGFIEISFNDHFNGVNSPPTVYNYDNAFLDIT